MHRYRHRAHSCFLFYMQMQPQITLTVSKNGKVLQTVIKDVEGNNLVKSLTDFQSLANSTITEMIVSAGEAGQVSNKEEEAFADSEDDEEDGEISPKKKKI